MAGAEGSGEGREAPAGPSQSRMQSWKPRLRPRRGVCQLSRRARERAQASWSEGPGMDCGGEGETAKSQSPQLTTTPHSLPRARVFVKGAGRRRGQSQPGAGRGNR
jgi:hypothetical protein